MRLVHVNLLNIGLMLASLGVAMVVPFETFLLAYAVLGPLHYLTQISWMRERQFFAKGRRDWLPLLLLTVGIVGGSLAAQSVPGLQWLGGVSVVLMTFAFGFAFVLATTADQGLRWAAAFVLGALALLLAQLDATALIFGLFLPTIVHVCLFTALFVVYGALKGRSTSAYASAVVMIACIVGATMLDPGTLGYVASDYARAAYQPFFAMHFSLMDVTGRLDHVVAAPTTPTDAASYPLADFAQLFDVAPGLQIGRLIAFAYTYHYLNWFSKTSVIRWHDVPRRNLVAIAVLWAASVALYAIDYHTGLQWLLFLSFLHVLLEFPLNWQSVLGIGRELRGRLLPSART